METVFLLRAWSRTQLAQTTRAGQSASLEPHVQCTFQAQNQRVVQPMLPTVQAHNRVAEPFSLPAVVPIAVPMAEPMAVPTAVPVGPAMMDPYQEEHQ